MRTTRELPANSDHRSWRYSRHLALALVLVFSCLRLQAAALSGAYEVLAAASTVNLTDEGTLDWAQWGRTDVDDFNHRTNVASQISTYTPIGEGIVLQFGDNFTGYSWTNGTPVLRATRVTAGIYVSGEGNGFEISVPADTTVRTLKVYVGAYAAQMRFQAELSDGSATPYVDDSFQNDSDGPNRAYVLNFAAASTGQRLVVRLTVLMNIGDGNVTLQAAALREGAPIIEQIKPVNGATFHPIADGLQFRVSTISPKTIPTDRVRLALNGVDVSSQLAFAGTETSRTATFNQLIANRFYQGTIEAADDGGQASTNRFTFDTFSDTGTVVIEAEDYNYFDGTRAGAFLDHPAPGAYQDFSGEMDTDYHSGGEGSNAYRPSDLVSMQAATDQVRPAWVGAAAIDYQLSNLANGDWFQFTRTFPAGSFVAYLRYASLADQTLQVDLVTGDASRPNPTLSTLGLISAPRTGNENSYRYAPLTDGLGNPIPLSLSGRQTLRLTCAEVAAGFDGLRANFLIVTPVDATGPRRPRVASAEPAPGAENVAPDATIRITMVDGDTAVVPATIRLALDASDVTPIANIQDTAEGASLTFQPAGPWAGNSSHTVTLVFGDTSSPSQAQTNNWSFTVANLPVISSTFATAPGSGRDPGFNVRTGKASNNADPATFTNSTARAELQLAGQLIDPTTGLPFENEAAGPTGDGRYIETGPINYEQDGVEMGYFGQDKTFPGVDAGGPDFIAMEVTAFLDLHVGIHRFGVRSDDGFRLTVGADLTNAPVELGVFEGGRSSALPDGSTEFEFLAESDGVYAFRLIWYEGTGGADLEWFSVDRTTLGTTNVVRTLINDSATGAIKAFRNREGSPTTGPDRPNLVGTQYAGGMFSTSFPSQAGYTYTLAYRASLADAGWQTTGSTVPGDGSLKTLTHGNAASSGFYRVEVR